MYSAPAFYIFSNDRLQVFCKYNLERNVTVDNVLQILEACDNCGHTSNDMKHYALQLIIKNFTRVTKLPKLQTLSKELLLDIISALADERNSQQPQITHDLSYANITSKVGHGQKF